jgi:hypothetical protein
MYIKSKYILALGFFSFFAKMAQAQSVNIVGLVGINNSNPAAPLQLDNSVQNRKIVLWDYGVHTSTTPDEHRFYGFGINDGQLRYQAIGEHVFYSNLPQQLSSNQVLKIGALGTFIQNKLVVGTEAVPSETMFVQGDAKVVGSFALDGNSITSGKTTTIGNSNVFGKMAVGTASTPVEQLYVQGDTKVVGKMEVAGKMEVVGNQNITGKLAVGTSITPALDFYVQGDAQITNNLEVTGRLNVGMNYFFSDYVIDGGTRITTSMTCPSGSQMVSGGGGHRDSNGAARDIVVNYTGPNPGNELNSWRVIMTNTDGSASRSVRIYVICSRLN